MMKLSIIIPVLNEAEVIGPLIKSLQTLRHRGHEVIVVDGGSRVVTREIAGLFVDQLIHAPAGRAQQMNAGAQSAVGHVLWFLHAVSQFPEEADELILSALGGAADSWGRFDIRLSGRQKIFRLLECMINLRSRLSGIATGDQGIFVSASLFNKTGGYPVQPLMEDIALCKCLKKIQSPVCIQEKLVTSSRRWEQNGVLSTILLMWRLRAAYFFGVPAEKLVGYYE